MMDALPGPLSLSQQRGPNYPVVVLLALLAAVTGLPRLLVCAKECLWAWATAEEGSSPLEGMNQAALAEVESMLWVMCTWADEI